MNREKEQTAIKRLKYFEPESEPYHLCFSGGKDSDCIRILAKLANVKHEVHHNLTTVDTPETVRYIKSIPDIFIDKAYDKDGNHVTMWNLIVQKQVPPTRIMRYCCEVLKEGGGKGKMKITGVRWAESNNRKNNADVIKIIGKPKTVQKKAEEFGAEYEVTKQSGLIMNTDNDENRRLVEYCYRTTSTMINPIVDWSDDDVWAFLDYYGCKSNPLYECGFKRIGCIGCPMASKTRAMEFERYPKYKQAYINAFDKMLIRREELGKPSKLNWQTGEDVFRWWIEEK